MTRVSWQEFRKKASLVPAKIALADAKDKRALEAAKQAKHAHIAEPVLIDPAALSAADTELFAKELIQLPKFKSLSTSEARERLQDPLVLGCLYLKRGLVDGFIGGATRTTSDTLRAVLSIIGLSPQATSLFGLFFIEAKDGRFVVLSDCAVVPEPSPKQLANIAIGAAAAYEFFTQDRAKVAMLSFSTQGSAVHPMVDKVRQAVDLIRSKAPALDVEGEWQADAALDRFSAEIKGAGKSPMAGQANVLIAPDLNCGNIAYKLVQRLGGCRAVGPVLWGTDMPANDLSRGCSTEDIVDMMALTSIQAHQMKALEKTTHAR